MRSSTAQIKEAVRGGQARLSPYSREKRAGVTFRTVYSVASGGDVASHSLKAKGKKVGHGALAGRDCVGEQPRIQLPGVFAPAGGEVSPAFVESGDGGTKLVGRPAGTKTESGVTGRPMQGSAEVKENIRKKSARHGHDVGRESEKSSRAEGGAAIKPSASGGATSSTRLAPIAQGVAGVMGPAALAGNLGNGAIGNARSGAKTTGKMIARIVSTVSAIENGTSDAPAGGMVPGTGHGKSNSEASPSSYSATKVATGGGKKSPHAEGGVPPRHMEHGTVQEGGTGRYSPSGLHGGTEQINEVPAVTGGPAHGNGLVGTGHGSLVKTSVGTEISAAIRAGQAEKHGHAETGNIKTGVPGATLKSNSGGQGANPHIAVGASLEKGADSAGSRGISAKAGITATAVREKPSIDLSSRLHGASHSIQVAGLPGGQHLGNAQGGGGVTPGASQAGAKVHVADLGSHLATLAAAGRTNAVLHLDPPALGAVSVRIDLNGGMVSMLFAADHPAAREAVTRSMDQLRNDLAARGVALASVSISGEGRSGGEPAREGANRRHRRFVTSCVSTVMSGKAGIGIPERELSVYV